MTSSAHRTADIVGIGFGPAQLALAYALADHGIGDRATFLEARDHFAWHPGMLLPETTMQINFTKDLVTPRNPTHPASFLNYLHEHGRLASFMNLKTMYPTRAEFTDYLEWAAARVPTDVQFGRRAEAVRWDARTRRFVVTAGGIRWHARHLVAGMGLQHKVPDGVVEGDRVWHSEHFLPNLQAVGADGLTRVVVVGSGQSSAEVARHLLTQHPHITVTAVLQRYGYAPADDSPFVNRVFDPEAAAEFYDAQPSAREHVLRAHRNTNYSVVNGNLIDELASVEYAQRLCDEPRFEIRHLTTLIGATPRGDVVDVVLEDLRDGHRAHHQADAVVLATGYRSVPFAPLFDDPERVFACVTDGVPTTDRHHRALLRDDVEGAVWIHGADERAHGLSTTLLSNIAVRGGGIARDIAATLLHESGRAHASAPQAAWAAS